MVKNLIYGIQEAVLDYRIGRQGLTGVYHTDYEIMLGANPVQSTDYPIIRSVLANCGIKKDDTVIDIGCGMGRFIGYLKLKGHKGRLVGVEIDSTYADFCTYLFRRCPNIEILNANALTVCADFPDDSVLYLYNPFKARVLDLFLSETRGRTIIYTNNVEKEVFRNHPEWVLEKDFSSRLNDGTPVGVSVFTNQRQEPRDSGPNHTHPV